MLALLPISILNAFAMALSPMLNINIIISSDVLYHVMYASVDAEGET